MERQMGVPPLADPGSSMRRLGGEVPGLCVPGKAFSFDVRPGP